MFWSLSRERRAECSISWEGETPSSPDLSAPQKLSLWQKDLMSPSATDNFEIAIGVQRMSISQIFL